MSLVSRATGMPISTALLGPRGLRLGRRTCTLSPSWSCCHGWSWESTRAFDVTRPRQCGALLTGASSRWRRLSPSATTFGSIETPTVSSARRSLSTKTSAGGITRGCPSHTRLYWSELWWLARFGRAILRSLRLLLWALVTGWVCGGFCGVTISTLRWHLLHSQVLYDLFCTDLKERPDGQLRRLTTIITRG